MLNFIFYDVVVMFLMLMLISIFSSNFSSILLEDSDVFVNEWICLRIFFEWFWIFIFFIRLVWNGWVLLGEGDRVCCYSCYVVYEGWRIGDDLD